MAMLAGPRERKRYNLVPRGKALYEDDTRYGTKMLEKMGWSKGKGLGANETGTQDFVRIRYKNDAQGLGYEDRDDQWTQHEESFTGLLKTLNGGEKAGKGDDDAGGGSAAEESELPTVGFGFAAEPKKSVAKKLKEKFSGESLEAKSKQSRARVHYKKFTRGKDLSRYSEKDLANIFGRKDTETEANALYQHLQPFTMEQPNAEQDEDLDKPGAHTVSSVSVSDYFKQKMEAMKHKLKNGTFRSAGEDKEETALVQDEPETIEETKTEDKKKKRKRKSETFAAEEEAAVAVDLEEPEPKKKKKKNSKAIEEEVESLIGKSADIHKPLESKKKKDKKVKELKEVAPTEAPKNKKDKVKELEEIAATEAPVATALDAESLPKKTKKKNKQKNQKEEQQPLVEAAQDAAEEIDSNPASLEANSTKKSKKENKEKSAAVVSTPIQQAEVEELLSKKSKKKKNSSPSEEVAATVTKKSKKPVSAIADDCNSKSTPELLSLDALIAQQNSYSVYTISSFCAEKFRNTDLNRFAGSNMAAISGYALTEDLRMDIKTIPGDADRITRLWNCTLDKYKNAQPKTVFYKYAKDVRKAWKLKEKRPRFQIKTWKRKHAFQGL